MAVIDRFYYIPFTSTHLLHIVFFIHISVQYLCLRPHRQKGSDASWKDDVEPPEECLDYSDDETERAARRKLQAKRKAGSGDKVQEDSNSTTQEGSSSATQEGSGENQPTESGVQLVKVMDHSKSAFFGFCTVISCQSDTICFEKSGRLSINSCTKLMVDRSVWWMK